MKLLLFLFFISKVTTDEMEQFFWKLHTANSPECKSEYQQFINCIEPHKPLITSITPSLTLESLYNFGLMNKILQVSRNVSECLGHDFKCEYLETVVYFLDYSDYIGSKMYGDAFHCFYRANTIDLVESCLPTIIPDLFLTREELEKLVQDNSYFRNKSNTALDCVAKGLYTTPSCTVNRIVDLYQAGVALADAGRQYLRYSGKYPSDWKFEEDNYCNN